MLTPNTPCLIMLMQQLYIEYNFTFSIFQLRYWTFVLTMLLRIMYFEEDQVDCRRPIYAWSLFLQLEKSLHFCNQVFEVHLYKDWQVYLCSSLLPRLLAHTQSNGAPLPLPPVQNHPWPNFNWRFYNPMPVLLSRKFATWPSIRTHFLLPTCLYLSSRQSFLNIASDKSMTV